MKSYSKSSSPAAKARRISATIRSNERATRSDKVQLSLLIARGHGHCKEAEKLRKRIDGRKIERQTRRARTRRS